MNMNDDVDKSINEQNMQVKYFVAKRVYPSEKGIHIEFATVEEARICYEDSLRRGITSNELDGLTITKKFKKNQLM